MIIKRGYIYLAALDPTIGSEINKTRPVIVVSNNINNEFGNTITIIPITSNTEKIYPFEVLIKKNIANLPKDSKAKADQIRTIDKMRIIKEIGMLPKELLSEAEVAIKTHLSF